MKRILIVDDEPDILNALRRLLMLTPCRSGDNTFQLSVDTFVSAEEALAKARHTAYDLVLSDYRMPGMDGVRFLMAIREIQPDAVRMILSGYADLNGLIAVINDACISRFVAKPWNDYELVSSIGQGLAMRELALENQRLADQSRLAEGTMTEEEVERKRLEAEEPGITQVIWVEDGSVLLDESLLDDRYKQQGSEPA